MKQDGRYEMLMSKAQACVAKAETELARRPKDPMCNMILALAQMQVAMVDMSHRLERLEEWRNA